MFGYIYVNRKELSEERTEKIISLTTVDCVRHCVRAVGSKGRCCSIMT